MRLIAIKHLNRCPALIISQSFFCLSKLFFDISRIISHSSWVIYLRYVDELAVFYCQFVLGILLRFQLIAHKLNLCFFVLYSLGCEWLILLFFLWGVQTCIVWWQTLTSECLISHVISGSYSRKTLYNARVQPRVTCLQNLIGPGLSTRSPRVCCCIYTKVVYLSDFIVNKTRKSNDVSEENAS